MKLCSVVLAGVLMSAPLAFAQAPSAPASSGDGGNLSSEYLHQAPGGKFEVTPAIKFESLRIEYKNTPTDATVYQIPLTAKAEYGINDMFSLAATVGYGVGGTSFDDCPSNQTCKGTSARGLIDPTLSANLRVPVGMGALRAGLNFSFSLEDSKEEADGDDNFATGGSTLTPYVGYEMSVGSNVFGARVAYDAVKGDRTHKDESDTAPTSTDKISGGEDLSLAGFYEYHFPRIFTVAGALEFIDSDETKTSTNGGAKTEDNNSSKILRFRIYAPMKFNETVTLIPTVSSGAYKFENDSNVDSSTLDRKSVV